MSKMIDLTGCKFGRLTVVERTENKHGKQVAWLCKCECGRTTVVQSYDLRSGNTQSCGCQRKENFVHKKHGKSYTRLHGIWKGMKSRCYNPNRKHYMHYGGRGIKVCAEWQEFQPFYEWAMANGYDDDLTIDRINVDGDYEPENCRWADSFVQGSNKTDVVYVEYNGEKHSLSEWEAITGIKHATLYNRIVKLKWSPEKTLTKKVKGSK